MFSFKIPGWARAAVVAILLAALPAGAASAQAVFGDVSGPNNISVTELSSQTLSVDYSLLGAHFTGDVTSGSTGGDIWAVGPHFSNFIESGLPDNSLAFGHVFWLEPGSSLDDLADARFNGFRLGSCSCGDQSPNVTFASDLTWATLSNFDDSNPWRDFFCRVDSVFTTCPILQNGQSFTTPMEYENLDAHLVVADPLTVTFNDRGDVDTGVPEPASWGLMLIGFGLAGATLRRRRALTA
jgi:hypothetical protein